MLQLSPRSAMIVVRGLGHSPVAAGHADSASRVSAPHLTVQLGRLGRVQAQRLHSQIQLLATRRVRSCFAKRRSLVDGGGRKMVERALIHFLLRVGVGGGGSSSSSSSSSGRTKLHYAKIDHLMALRGRCDIDDTTRRQRWNGRQRYIAGSCSFPALTVTVGTSGALVTNSIWVYFLNPKAFSHFEWE